jgi:DNA repair exonuclease SbcCD ATPase subunit
MKLLNRPPKLELSKSERERLVATAKELENINRRFAEIAALRQTLRDAAADFVAGRLPILEAVALGSFSRVDHDTAQGNLVRALKSRLRELLDQSADLIHRHREHAADVAQARLEEAEQAERKAARTAGIDDDDFRPSGNLERLGADLYAAKDLCGDEWPIRQHDLVELFASAGIAAPTTSAVTSADDDDD